MMLTVKTHKVLYLYNTTILVVNNINFHTHMLMCGFCSRYSSLELC